MDWAEESRELRLRVSAEYFDTRKHTECWIYNSDPHRTQDECMIIEFSTRKGD